VLLLGLVLLAALVAARTCASADRKIDAQEAVELARAKVTFTPCPEKQCAFPQFVQRGIPPRPYWVVRFAEDYENGVPTRAESYLVDASTGEVSRS
jgi:hypothetical protein